MAGEFLVILAVVVVIFLVILAIQQAFVSGMRSALREINRV